MKDDREGVEGSWGLVQEGFEVWVPNSCSQP